MAGPDRALPYRNQFWANTQKHTINAYHDRWLLFGATLGEDDELEIVRHDLSGLMDSVQATATVASQTGLHINIKDSRDGVTGLKLSNAGGGDGDFVQGFQTGVERFSINEDGVYVTPSLAELKDGMRDLTDKQIEKMLTGVKVYRFTFKNSSGKVRVGPEAAEFHKLTGFGDPETVAPGTVAGLALRLVKWVYEKVVGIEERLTAVENRLAVTEGSDDTQEV